MILLLMVMVLVLVDVVDVVHEGTRTMMTGKRMMMKRSSIDHDRPRSEARTTVRASLRSRNAGAPVTRAIANGNLQEQGRKPE